MRLKIALQNEYILFLVEEKIIFENSFDEKIFKFVSSVFRNLIIKKQTAAKYKSIKITFHPKISQLVLTTCFK